MKKIFYSTAIIFSLFLTSSCKKNKTEETTDPTEKKYELDYKANALIQVETIANEMEFIGRSVPKNSIQFPNGSTFLGVATVTRITTTTGQEITLDFGAGSICTDGKYRSGVLVIDFNTTSFDTAVRPQTYKVDNVEVKGDYIMGDVTTPGTTDVNFKVIAPSGSLVKDNQNSISFNLSRISKQVEGLATAEITDDVFDRSELSYNLTIKEQNKTTYLIVEDHGLTSLFSKLKYACSNKYSPVNGSVYIRYSATGQSTDPNNPLSGTFYLTFGNGNCGDKPFTQKNL